MTTVLVTDGNERSTLAAVRSLGAAGYTVLVAAVRPRSLAGASRWCAAELTAPDPLEAPGPFVETIAATRGVDVVLPMTDASTTAVLARRDAFGATRIPCGSLEAFARISDKQAAAVLAESLAIRVPRQLIRAAPDAEPLAGVVLPAVLKPARSVSGDAAARSKHVVVHVATREEMTRALQAMPPTAYPLLVQERIVGPGIGVFLLVWKGELLAAFAHRRLREKPPAGGVSVYAESVPLEPGLLERSRRLVEAAGWQGVAMVEYKVDERSGEPVLMEINGRFWGSLQLAIDAGVDFPRLLVAAARGEPVRPVTAWRIGVRSRWFWGDVDHGLTRLWRSSRALHLPPGAPGRVATVASLLATTLRFPHDQVYRLDDPGPGLAELRQRLRGR